MNAWGLIALGVIVIFLLYLLGYQAKPTAKSKSATGRRLPSSSSREDVLMEFRAQGHQKPGGEFVDAKPAFPVKAVLRFKYIDRNGEQTERTVDVKEVGTGISGNMLVGRCRLRNAMRTFYLYRIQFCFDEETGEIISNIYDYLHEKYEKTPDKMLQKLISDQYDAMRILLYVSKADGVLRAAERAIIRDTCRDMANESNITDRMIDNVFRDIGLMSEKTFKLAVRRLAKASPNIYEKTLSASVKIVATDNKVHPAEQAALDYMNKKHDHSVIQSG